MLLHGCSSQGVPLKYSNNIAASRRGWALAALGLTAMIVTVGLKAWRHQREATGTRSPATKEDSDAIARLEGEGGLVLKPSQAHSRA